MTTPNTPPAELDYRETANRLTIDGDTAIIRRQQDIPDSFFQRLAAIRDEQDRAPIGEFMHVAEIPGLTVERWMAEGFNITDPNITGKMILARLRAEDSEKLITTSRSL